VNVFLAHSRRDERPAAAIQASLRYYRREISRFDFGELVDERYDFLREATACVVLFSPNSLLTEAVRFSHRLLKAKCRRLVLIDDHWDIDPQAAAVFRKFDSERLVFKTETVVSRLIRLFDGIAGSDALARPGDEPFERSAMTGKLTTFDLLAGPDPALRARRASLREIFADAPRPGSCAEHFPSADPAARPLRIDTDDEQET
jgi:hypothetical protein